jgi:hypothetical protein
LLLKVKPLSLQYLAKRLGAFISKLFWSRKHFEPFNIDDFIPTDTQNKF